MSNIKLQEDRQIARIVDDMWDDRVSFAKHIMGMTPTNQQGDALVAMDGDKPVTIKSGHGTGKTATEVVIIMHYMCCRPYPRVLCTAPSRHQLHDVLWAELSLWRRRMNSIFSQMFECTKEKMFHVKHPEEWFAIARTATKENPEALQGIHGDYVLKILEEASGIPEPIFEVTDGAHGLRETKELMCANPTRLSGTFFMSFNQNKDEYTRLSWSCLDSSLLTDGKYARRMERKYGRDSNIYRIRVLGEFPKQDGDSFIPYHLVEDAIQREIPDQKAYPKVFAVDVARFGSDDTVIAIRQGDEFKPCHVLQGKSTMEVAGYIALLANDQKPKRIFIDVIGIGSGVYDRLEELGFPVIPVCVSESPAMNPEKYKRLRDELWGNMRDWLEMRRGKLCDNDDRDLAGELTTPKYRITSDGKIVIETKDEMKKRGLASPNKADAAIMTFAQPMNEYTMDDDSTFYGHTQSDYQPLDMEAGY